MKMLYISSIPLPSPYANRLQVVKMSEAFAKHCDFTLCISGIKGKREDVYRYYHVTAPFRILELGRAPRHLRTLVYGVKMLRIIFREKPDVIFVREAPLAIILSLVFSPVVFEMHDFPEKRLWLHKILLKRVARIVSTNRWKAEQITSVFGIPAEKILYVPNGVDLAEFNVAFSTKEARERLGLPTDVTLVVYTGQLFSWKGGDILLAATKFLPDTFRTYFIGGTKEDQQKVASVVPDYDRKKALILPHQPHDLIPVYLRAADVLVVPNTAREEISKFHTSPIKLFEYLASKKPIVCSDIPSLREIVSEKEVLFFSPDDPKDLAKKIETTVANPENAARQVEQGYKRVQGYTWDARANAILSFLRKSGL